MRVRVNIQGEYSPYGPLRDDERPVAESQNPEPHTPSPGDVPGNDPGICHAKPQPQTGSKEALSLSPEPSLLLNHQEMFPTTIRGLVMGLLSSLGRIASAIAQVSTTSFHAWKLVSFQAVEAYWSH